MDPLHPIEYLPRGGAPQLLFLLFHGAGGRPYDLSPVMDRLVAEYPQAALLSLAAPEPFDAVPGGGAGFQWFSLRELNASNLSERVGHALPGFVQAIRAQQARFALDWVHTALVGFSQGATMALEAVQAEPQLAGRVIAFAGRYANLPRHAPEDTTLHLLHGLQDDVVPARPTMDAARRLVALGADVTGDAMPGVGHELDDRLIERAVEHLRSFLPKRAWREALAQAPIVNRPASSRDLQPPTRPAREAADDA